MILKIAMILLALIILGGILFARSKGVSPLSWKMHKPISQQNKIAIGGFDPVHFIKKGEAEKGKPQYQYLWKEVNWHFTSSDHLEEFKKMPDQYAPQFGGYCSFAISKGFTATSDPQAWHNHEGKLHLFADEGVKKQWIEQLPQALEIGYKKWID